MSTWGAPEPVAAANLAAGDFVVHIPAAAGLDARDVGSGVAALDWDYGPWPPRPRRRAAPNEIIRVITFLNRTTIAIPAAHELVVRRRTESTEAA